LVASPTLAADLSAALEPSGMLYRGQIVQDRDERVAGDPSPEPQKAPWCARPGSPSEPLLVAVD
jgi:hypothetical protein